MKIKDLVLFFPLVFCPPKIERKDRVNPLTPKHFCCEVALVSSFVAAAAVFAAADLCAEEWPRMTHLMIRNAGGRDTLGAQASTFNVYNITCDSQLSLVSPLILVPTWRIKMSEFTCRIWSEPGSKLAKRWLIVG